MTNRGTKTHFFPIGAEKKPRPRTPTAYLGWDMRTLQAAGIPITLT